VRTARGLQYRWVNTRRARNEALDCTVYALFCTHMLNLHVRSDAQWERIAEAVQPANRDLFMEPPPQEPPEQAESVEADEQPAVTSGARRRIRAIGRIR
jgi:phage terminase large subunit GpA-like protein